MSDNPTPETANWLDAYRIWFYRLAAGGALPARWFEHRLPNTSKRHRHGGHLTLEIVSHCWQYSHMLLYQLSSLVLYPPTQCNVTMTVFYSDEDKNTKELLDYFSEQDVPGVTWHWQSLHRYSLFRRSIGRNIAAKNTSADWIWFTDCDLIFHEHCLDTLNTQLQQRNDALIFPREELTTALLAEDDPLLTTGKQVLQIRDINKDLFEVHQRTRATGPLQITHGDVARAVGYCECIHVYQKPARHWCKAHEDRAHRWLLESQGEGLDIPSVYRIRHVEKGRYKKDSLQTTVRQKTRAVQSSIRGE